MPSMSAAALGLKNDAPIHAPRMAGAPARTPSSMSVRVLAFPERATGATIARPSVVLWSAKPTTSAAPSASEPTAYAEPIARPSPRLWRPIPSATRKAARSPWSAPSLADFRRSLSQPSTPASAR